MIIKYTIRLFLIIMVFQPCIGLAQRNNSDWFQYDPKVPKSVYRVYKTNPLAIFWGPTVYSSEYKIIAETPMGYNKSGLLGISYIGRSPLVDYLERNSGMTGLSSIQVIGYRVQGAYRIYGLIAENYSPAGLYISPHFSYADVKYFFKNGSTNRDYLKISHLNVNLLAGYQFLFMEKICVDMFCGLGYKKNEWKYYQNQNISTVITPDEDAYYKSNLKISLGFSIGYAF